MDRKVKLWKMPPRPSRTAEQDGSPAAAPGLPMGLGALQRSAGNRAVQQLFPAAATARRTGPTVQRDRQGGPKPDGATVETPLIPPAWVRQPGAGDIIVARFGDQMVALPAQGNFVLIRPTTAEIQPTPPTPLVTVPTVNKESIKMVNVGGQTGFLIDAGGNPNINFPTLNNSTTTSGVLFPGAFSVMSAALGVQSTAGVIITHLHDDHVQSLFQIVLNNGIRPENIHFPEGFAINANAPSSTFARLLTMLQNDPVAQGFGHRPNAAYGVIRTPSQGNWWRSELRSGEVKFEMYGITAAFRELEARRAAGQPQESARVGGQSVPSLADTASLITRITHEPSGLRVIFVSDSRFTDLAMLKAAMGAGYAEMLEGVTVIEGLGHHLGALESSADLTGLAEFLKDAQLRSGNLIVIAQSQERRSGRQFLNRSFIAALNAAGIRVKVALEPVNGGRKFYDRQ